MPTPQDRAQRLCAPTHTIRPPTSCVALLCVGLCFGAVSNLPFITSSAIGWRATQVTASATLTASPTSGMVVTVPLSLSPPTVAYGQSLTGNATLQNTGAESVTLRRVAIAGRPPGGTNAGGPFDDFGALSDVTLAPGQSVTISETRTFARPDPLGTWYSYLTYQIADTAYHDQPPVSFTVTAGAATSTPTATTTAGTPATASARPTATSIVPASLTPHATAIPTTITGGQTNPGATPAQALHIAAERFAFSPNRVTYGQRATARVTLRNTGNTRVTVNLFITFIPPGDGPHRCYGCPYTIALEPHQVTTVVKTFTFSRSDPLGQWQVMALYRLPGSSDPHKTYHVSHALAFASVNEEMLLRVDGNRLVDGQGHLVVLHGVNRPGAEYQCLQPGGLIFDGPADDASVAAIASWWTNVVRIPLSEDCWLGINHVPPRSSGARYRQAIQAYVHLLHLHGLYAILDLHRSAPGTILATQQYQMADRDHAIDFWRQVATTFKADRGTIFDLFNEPFGLSWQCWRDGGTCADVPFTIAGMQTLITTIRQTGARNVIMVSGVNLANDLSGWIRYQPSDPLHNLVASWHTYGESFACSTPACWRHTLLPAARRVPVVVGEMGEYDCAHTYIESLMPWLDRSGIGYLGWAWVTSSCAGYPALISSYTGTPTNFGIGLRNHLRDLARTPTSSRR